MFSTKAPFTIYRVADKTSHSQSLCFRSLHSIQLRPRLRYVPSTSEKIYCSLYGLRARKRRRTVGVSLKAAKNVCLLVGNPSERAASITLPSCQQFQQLTEEASATQQRPGGKVNVRPFTPASEHVWHVVLYTEAKTRQTHTIHCSRFRSIGRHSAARRCGICLSVCLSVYRSVVELTSDARVSVGDAVAVTG